MSWVKRVFKPPPPPKKIKLGKYGNNISGGGGGTQFFLKTQIFLFWDLIFLKKKI